MNTSSPAQDWKLWIYTNYDCNLRCSYCLARSSPEVPRRAIGLENVQRLVDEAVALGFSDLFLTGGEPTILDEIYAMIAYATPRIRTTLLTNAMLLRGRRMERLVECASPNLTVQVSLDGACAADHDAYRGVGTWAKTVAGIEALLERGFHVRLSTTETPANTARLAEICTFHEQLGIPESDHFVRPMARRGFAETGVEVNMLNLAPELTVDVDGIFWHPLSTDKDMLVSKSIFPLACAVEQVKQNLDTIARTGKAPLMTFT
ncbi:MoaA-related protein [Oscillochloris trichoides DG-6]|uniref:MoaA-related protein n=1 Tax=Oscillochloris trichoides DG-6 TaxID=765420 RepID=E1IED2_9CHLR|nr:radical SAM protein [Oscillochloris trichoides]EFO80458.1 MoaA-related protein [Oscillochloris trichoides DG-6]